MNADFENINVIVADDDAQFGAYVQALLEGWGCHVSLVSDGAEGLRLIEQARPDLVLTDISMPQADGLELIMAIRQIDADLPVIVMSGAFMPRTEAYLRVSQKLGASSVLAKPFSSDQLREAMRTLLSGEPVLHKHED